MRCPCQNANLVKITHLFVFFRADKFGMERYLHKGMCVDACPEAFYHTTESTCEPCSENCHVCTSHNHCLKCNSSYYVSNGVCVKQECGEGKQGHSIFLMMLGGVGCFCTSQSLIQYKHKLDSNLISCH